MFHKHRPTKILYDGEKFVSYCSCGVELVQDYWGRWIPSENNQNQNIYKH